MAQRVNYDQVSNGYDQRYATGGLAGIYTSLQQVAQQVQAQHLLEVGCGTAHWLSQIKTGPFCFGLDFSRGMLQKAQRKDKTLHLVQGTASRLPYRTAYFDMVYCVNALHHFDDAAAFIYEARRILRPGGVLAIIGTDPHSQTDHTWYVYDYFPGTYERDLQRFVSSEKQLNWMQQAGFENCSHKKAEHIENEMIGESVLADHFLSKNGNSQLALLSEEAYRQGMERIKADIESARKKRQEISFLTCIDVELIYGFSPSA